MMEDGLKMEVELEDGSTMVCELQDTVFYNNDEYGVFLPLTDDEGSDVIIVRIEETDDGEILFDPELEDAVLSGVFEIFKEHFQDVYEFDD